MTRVVCACSVGGKGIWATDVWEFTGGEGGRGSKYRLYLNLGTFSVGGAHDCVLLLVLAVNRAEGVRSFCASNFRIGVTHQGLPDFDGLAPFEDIYPYGTPENSKYEWLFNSYSPVSIGMQSASGDR